MITFLVTSAQFQPSGGIKIDQIGGFQPFSGILIAHSISNMVITLVRGVFRSDLILGHVGLISSLWWPSL